MQTIPENRTLLQAWRESEERTNYGFNIFNQPKRIRFFTIQSDQSAMTYLTSHPLNGFQDEPSSFSRYGKLFIASLLFSPVISFTNLINAIMTFVLALLAATFDPLARELFKQDHMKELFFMLSLYSLGSIPLIGSGLMHLAYRCEKTYQLYYNNQPEVLE